MRAFRRVRGILVLILLAALIAGCLPASTQPHGSPLTSLQQPAGMTPRPPTTIPTATVSTPTATLATMTPPLKTATASPTTPAAWVTRLPNSSLTVPILMYHHVAVYSGTQGRYYIQPGVFRKQMQSLHNWGYETITITQLRAALLEDGPLPLHPVAITFDDGNKDIYEIALPVLQEFGFTATLYVITGEIKKGNGITVDQAKELAEAGWEIASHSMTHPDLVKTNADLRSEICYSRLELKELLDMEILSFSYPYGSADDYLKHYVRDCGYTSAVGVGLGIDHTAQSVFFLSRREVEGDFTMDEFAALLPSIESP